MLLQGIVGGWAVIEASHTVRSGLNVTCHMLNATTQIYSYYTIYLLFCVVLHIQNIFNVT